MARMFRRVGIVALVFSLVSAVAPVSAWAAVSLTHERNWGSSGWGDGQFRYLSDVACDKWGNVFVAGGENGDDRVQMFSADGGFLKSVGAASVIPAIVRPRTVTADRWGTVYVGEKGQGGTIRLYNPLLYSEIGTVHESIANEVSGPSNIAVALDGTLYSVESGSKVQRWRHRNFVDEWTSAGFSTMGCAVTQDGIVLTTTDLTSGITHSVITYDATGGYLDDWGGYGTANGQFKRPYDVGADPLGNVYVVEAEGARGQVFSPDGNHLTTFGSSGSGVDQFSNVYGIAVGFDRRVYVADMGHDRVSKWKVTVPTESVQLAGADRIRTAVEVSKKAYPKTADVAVIATGANWPDALGGAALAGAVKGPLLLTNKATLPSAVAAELDRLKVKRVYVLGGTSAVSDAVLNAAKAHTTTGIATRLGGADRYKTAIAIADETKAMLGGDYDGNAFVVTGQNFPDALAASPVAAANGWPIYLTPPAKLPADVRASMMRTYGGNPSNHGYIVGGPAAVSPTVAAELGADPFMGFMRVSGANRYETAARLADDAFDGMGMLFSRPALATGENFPDALAGGVLQGSDCSPVLLTPSGRLDGNTESLLRKYKDHIYEIRFIGGDVALKPAVRTKARSLLW